MKKDIETMERFVEMRAKGRTFQQIADELGISKQTAVGWAKDLKEEIEGRKALEWESLGAKYYLTERAKIELFGEIVATMKEDLDRRIKAKHRDFGDLSISGLLNFILRYHEKLEKIYSGGEFMTKQDIKDAKVTRETWNTLLKSFGS